MMKKKVKRQIANYYAEDEYGMHDTCSICDVKMINKPYYELSVTYLGICLRCAGALQRARIIRLQEPKPPPKPLIMEEYFPSIGNKIRANFNDGRPYTYDLTHRGKIIERHPK